MNRMLRMIFVFTCCMFWAALVFAAPNIQDGLWEITTTVEMKGMPAGMMQPIKHTACLTKKDAVPEKPAKADCKITDMKLQGDTVSWTVTCPNAISSGKVTYSGTTFDGTMETTMNEDGGKMMVKNKMKGKRIGPCK